jgi:hypothetical protein
MSSALRTWRPALVFRLRLPMRGHANRRDGQAGIDLDLAVRAGRCVARAVLSRKRSSYAA